MALENPLPPRTFREQAKERRSIRNSDDGVPFFTDTKDSEERLTKLDLKQIVTAGKMSISPSNRDVVIASRAGLFILDLENPRHMPAFLPQGGMLEMADIQWNPHINWSEYILSTSGEKLLVWNLRLGSNHHIQHTLEVHYRAITDINWHTQDPSRIATCAIDAWVWLWDLRSPTPATNRLGPTMGLCAFNESATQVKWSYHNPWMLASAHNNEVLIWDERKGSIPVSTIKAHDSKIYGIDWSRFSPNELTTCSLGKTIKTWNVLDTSDGKNMQPLQIIRTDYPVWRARNLPFGRGILAQPHRGRCALDMFSADQPSVPVYSFEGLTDVASEFVWRSLGHGRGREYQLISWDKDSILRFWPIDTTIMEKVGYNPNTDKPSELPSPVQDVSYRDILESESHLNRAITAPTHQSGVLKSVKASKSGRGQRSATASSSVGIGSSISPISHFKKPLIASQIMAAGVKQAGTTATMGKGHGKAARPQLDPQAWNSVVEEESKRSRSTETGSSLRRSTSRAGETFTYRGRKTARSGSLSLEYGDEPELPKTLKEEIQQATSKFASSKLKIVDVVTTNTTRKCTIEVHGRPGLLVRVFFNFPVDYPGGQRPPLIDIEHIRPIAPRKRAKMLRELRNICAQNPLCIDPCIRFLTGLPSHGGGQKPFSLESDSEEEDVQVDELPDTLSGGAFKIQQNQPPRERTGQAVFSINGALVRIVSSDRPKLNSSPTQRSINASGKVSHLGDLPLALRGLAQMASELPIVADEGSSAETSYNFADSFSTQPGVKHTGILGPMWNRGMPFKPRARDKAKVVIDKFPTPNPDAFDSVLAAKFIYTKIDPEEFCLVNAVAAAYHGRYDYRRILESLATFLKRSGGYSALWSVGDEGRPSTVGNDPMARGIKIMYKNLAARRNLQMLAMFSIAILLAEREYLSKGNQAQPPILSPVYTDDLGTRQSSNVDYFSLRPRGEAPHRLTQSFIPVPSTSPDTEAGMPPASTPPQHSLSGTLASKAGGAFSSVLYPLFFTGTSEGSDNSHKNRGSDPPTPSSIERPDPIPIPSRGGFLRSNLRSPRPRRGKNDTSAPTPTPAGSGPSSSGAVFGGSLGRLSAPSRTTRKPPSLFVPTPGTAQKVTITFALVGQPKAHLTSSVPQERWKREGRPPVPNANLVLDEDPKEANVHAMPASIRAQLVAHIQFYAELLYRVGLQDLRNEVLKITNELPLEVQFNTLERNHLAIFHLCRVCFTEEVDDQSHAHLCIKCQKSFLYPACTYCRLPVKGLSRTCLRCNHTTHLQCWKLRPKPLCASGCGCMCPNNSSFNVRFSATQSASVSPTSPNAYQGYTA